MPGSDADPAAAVAAAAAATLAADAVPVLLRWRVACPGRLWWWWCEDEEDAAEEEPVAVRWRAGPVRENDDVDAAPDAEDGDVAPAVPAPLPPPLASLRRRRRTRRGFMERAGVVTQRQPVTEGSEFGLPGAAAGAATDAKVPTPAPGPTGESGLKGDEEEGGLPAAAAVAAASAAMAAVTSVSKREARPLSGEPPG